MTSAPLGPLCYLIDPLTAANIAARRGRWRSSKTDLSAVITLPHIPAHTVSNSLCQACHSSQVSFNTLTVQPMRRQLKQETRSYYGNGWKNIWNPVTQQQQRLFSMHLQAALHVVSNQSPGQQTAAAHGSFSRS